MIQAADIWHSGALETTLDGIRLIALIALIVAAAAKLWSMQRYTRRWNGLGRALRFEKATYLVLWVWVLLRGVVPGLDHPVAFVAIAALIIGAEVRSTLRLPIADRFRAESRPARDARRVREQEGGTP